MPDSTQAHKIYSLSRQKQFLNFQPSKRAMDTLFSNTTRNAATPHDLMTLTTLLVFHKELIASVQQQLFSRRCTFWVKFFDHGNGQTTEHSISQHYLTIKTVRPYSPQRHWLQLLTQHASWEQCCQSHQWLKILLEGDTFRSLKCTIKGGTLFNKKTLEND